ncbi:MAG TPA: RNA pseudouridine synthase [Candidatus Scybalousia intestinigallinarum]|nr:RNA pseudouridine synthase [Candidatus Scybalousia intestinigallinarum]
MMLIPVHQKMNIIDFLLENTDYSKKKIKSLLKFRAITLEHGKVLSHEDLVREGQTVVVSTEKKETKIGNIEIIYEDENYLVVDKPSGMLTVSTDKERNRTLYHLVREYVHQKEKKEKIFIVHRLDRETSGLVLFAKDEKLKQKLQEDWENVALTREYTAVVSGILEEKEARLVHYLKENQQHKVYVSPVNSGKKAITDYQVLAEDKNSLLKLSLSTGRKNQIRVQLSYLNHPIIGDLKYGGCKAKRLYLHASKLVICDPFTKKKFTFVSKPPREFKRVLSI